MYELLVESTLDSKVVTLLIVCIICDVLAESEISINVFALFKLHSSYFEESEDRSVIFWENFSTFSFLKLFVSTQELVSSIKSLIVLSSVEISWTLMCEWWLAFPLLETVSISWEAITSCFILIIACSLILIISLSLSSISSKLLFKHSAKYFSLSLLIWFSRSFSFLTKILKTLWQKILI